MLVFILILVGWFTIGYWCGQRLLQTERFSELNNVQRSRAIFLAIWVLLWTGLIAGVMAINQPILSNFVAYASLFALILFAVRILRRRFLSKSDGTNIFKRKN